MTQSSYPKAKTDEWFDENIKSFGRTTFEIKPEHLILLRSTYIGWNDCEFGAPEIDPQRPYGNSQVLHDIAEILGIDPEGGGKYERWFSEEQKEYMERLHSGLQETLQIAIYTGRFETGVYEAPHYSTRTWRKIQSSPTTARNEE